MKTNQTTCDSDRINLFLDQKLSDDEQAAFESHLTECDECCRRLEATAASEDAWRHARDCLRGDATDDPRADDSAAGEDVSSSQATILKLLAPTDDDRMIGRWGTYEVVGVVGTGGMGVVLKAFESALNRYVAIKILAPHLGTSGAAIRRFSREGKAAAAVVHDNVIEIYGVAEAAGLPYLVMPYVRGPSLQRRLDDEGPMATVEILRVAMQAAAGLAAAHAQGLVHRDVKPANILLADGIERVKLTDFGLARAADDASLTRTGVIAGTPQYMSPEQARGEPVDPRSDLFSLGSVLYAMCTGRAPFRAETSYGVLRRITDEEPRTIREINPDVPDWLCAIVSKLMAKRPDDRFQSASEVAALLEQCLAHVQQPTAVPLPKVAGTLRVPSAPNSPLLPGEGQGVRATWSGRKRVIAAAIGLFFGGLILAFGILIHVKKDHKTTTVEVPDGSTAHVDEHGAVTVELPLSNGAATPSENETTERMSREAIDLDGGRNYIDFGNPRDGHLDVGDVSTMQTWIRFDALPEGSCACLLGKDEGGYDRNKWIFGYSCNYRGVARATIFHINSPASGPIWLKSDPWTPELGRWYNLAVVKDGNDYTFYVDGKANGTDSTTVAVPKVQYDMLMGRAEGDFELHGAATGVQMWKKALTAGQVRNYMNAEPAADAEGLVGAWRFKWSGNEVLPRATMYDSSHYGTQGDLKLVENLLASPALGADHPPHLCFDGQPGSYVSVPNMDMNRLTFATWVKRDVTQQKQYMIMSSRKGGWGVYFSEIMPRADHRGPNNDLLWFTYRGVNCWSSDVAVADTHWHFVAVTLEDHMLCFYVDGKPAGKAAMPDTLASQGGDYWLGGVTPSDINPHDGLRGCLAETLIFDRALDADKIATLYRRGRAPHSAALDGLIAGYHFDEGRGTTANDFSDHGRNGTLHGGVTWSPGTASSTGAVQWSEAKGGNGHWYQAVSVPDGITWTDAKNAAQAMGGYLATITSADENAFVYSLVDNDRFWQLLGNNACGPWIGGAYDMKTGAWQWATGERWGYTNWFPGQPDHQVVPPEHVYAQDSLHFYGGAYKRTPMWDDDWHDNANTVAYVVEWDTRPDFSTPPHPAALHFDQRHYAAVLQPAKFTADDFTISLWLKPDSKGPRDPTVAQYILNRGIGYQTQRGDMALKIGRLSHGLDFCLFGSDGGRSDWIFGWDVPETRMRSPVRFDKWNHVVVTRSGDKYTMWMNGKRVVSEQSGANVSDADNTHRLTIGGPPPESGRTESGFYESFLGDVNDFRIFRRCLSDKEIDGLYTSNGDETFLGGEGRVKVGPLCARNVKE